MNKIDVIQQKRTPARIWFYVQCVAALGMLVAGAMLVGTRQRTEAVGGRSASPLYFEPNQGQLESSVRYLARGNGYSLYLAEDEAVFALRPAGARAREAMPPMRLAMKLVNGQRAAAVRGEELQASRSNYLIGNDAAAWRRGVPHYAKVRYEQIYPGIDLVYYGNQRELEYDFFVAPGADPKRIGVAFDGVEALRVAEDGGLVLQTPEGEIRQQRPVVYQEIAGSRREVAGRYVIRGESEIGFEVGAYDASQALVIDPVLIYSTYNGGSDEDFANGIAADSNGNTYVSGISYSPDFPTKNALQFSLRGVGNAWVAKYDASGRLVYNTYLGGNAEDVGFSIVTDSAGNAYVGGTTDSTDFPITNSSVQPQQRGRLDGFLAKLNSDGSALIYSTYLGGSADDVVTGIAIDGTANIYLTGQTLSNNFPVRGASQSSMRGASDAFVTKLSADGGTWVYSTYLGGNGKEVGYGVAVDGAGSAYVTGFVLSTDFPTRNAAQAAFGGRVDAFVSKLTPGGDGLVYSTFLGGAADDGGYGISVDGAGNATVTGFTNSANWPTKNAFQATPGGADDVFVTRLDAAGALAYSSYLGGAGDEVGFNLVSTTGGDAYVVGRTNSANFPVVDPVQAKLGQPAGGAAASRSGGGAAQRMIRRHDGEMRLPIQDEYGRDAFRRAPAANAKAAAAAEVVDGLIAKITAAGTVAYASYLGGNDVDKLFSVATDNRGNAYVAGLSSSGNYPVKSAAQRSLRGVTDGVVTKISDNATTQASVSAASYQFTTGLAPESIVASFGAELAGSVQSSATTPLPTALGGVRVLLRRGTEPDQVAPLFFVSPTQINYLMPAGVSDGDVRVIVEVNGVVLSAETARVSRVAPGLFSANASGQGVAAGVALRVRPDGTQSYEPIARFDSTVNRFVSLPIDLSNGQVYLILFGTGWRNRESLGSVAASLGGTAAQVLYAGPQSDFAGLDQINLLLPASLAGRGEVNLELSVGGKTANRVVANFK